MPDPTPSTPALPAICTDTYLTDRDRESIREAMHAHAEAVAAVRVREALEEAAVHAAERGEQAPYDSLPPFGRGQRRGWHDAATYLRARAARVGEDGA